MIAIYLVGLCVLLFVAISVMGAMAQAGVTPVLMALAIVVVTFVIAALVVFWG